MRTVSNEVMDLIDQIGISEKELKRVLFRELENKEDIEYDNKRMSEQGRPLSNETKEQIKRILDAMGFLVPPDDDSRWDRFREYESMQIGSNCSDGLTIYEVYDKDYGDGITNNFHYLMKSLTDVSSYLFATGSICSRRSALFAQRCRELNIRNDWQFVCSVIMSCGIKSTRSSFILTLWAEFLYNGKAY